MQQEKSRALEMTAEQRIGHLAHDAVEPIGDHGHDHGVERVGARLASGLGHRAPRYDLKM
jgi:hypothetical protein